MKKILVVSAIVLSMFGLSACDIAPTDADREQRIEDNRVYEEKILKQGKECFDAGGNWTHSGWTGYSCEFIQKGVTIDD